LFVVVLAFSSSKTIMYYSCDFIKPKLFYRIRWP